MRERPQATLLQGCGALQGQPGEEARIQPDIGSQYRSAIFPADAEQARIAKAYVAQLNQARAFPAAIVTKIEVDRPFYPAEAYHQDFMARNPMHPYIVYNDTPKLADLQRIFPRSLSLQPCARVSGALIELRRRAQSYRAPDAHGR